MLSGRLLSLLIGYEDNSIMIDVVHVMRTYGVHGGERQLGQLFSSFSEPRYRHIFYSIYRNVECEKYFSNILELEQKYLLPLKAVNFPNIFLEFLILLLLLPFFWIKMYFNLLLRKPEIIFAHGFQAALVCWFPALLFSRKKFVYVHRGTKSTIGKHHLFKLIYKPFDIVAGVSNASRDSMVGLASSSKLMTISNGIDLSKFIFPLDRNFHKNELILISVGRLISSKGQAFLINAFSRICNQTNIVLNIVGDGPDELILKDLAKSLGVYDKVHFLGHQDDVATLISNADIFVFASESEGLSNAVLEAMALGIPSIVIDAPGVSECHIDSETGFITDRELDIFIKKILLLVNSPELRKKMGENARARVESFYSIEANCNQYLELYRKLLNNEKRN
jgi:glycosyltransferase involved in cell wall biosynthesis